MDGDAGSAGPFSSVVATRHAQLTAEQQRHGAWARMVRDPEVYAKGSIRHPDHATIHLDGWHRVLMNAEQRARAMQHVVFID
jgi:hypothetical protein